jgi:hypothetical protein
VNLSDQAETVNCERREERGAQCWRCSPERSEDGSESRASRSETSVIAETQAAFAVSLLHRHKV